MSLAIDQSFYGNGLCKITKRSTIVMNQSEKDRKIESIRFSINQGYEKLSRIESDLEEVRRKRGEIIFQNDINLSVNKEK